MKKYLISLLFAILAAPVLASTPPLPIPAEDTCNANNYAKFLGKPREIIDSKEGYYFQDPYNIVELEQSVEKTDRTDIIYIILNHKNEIATLTCIPPTSD